MPASNLKPTLLLIDYNNLFYRGSNVHPDLEHNGQFTGGFYGFVQQLASTANETAAQMIVACKDTPPYFRTTDFPAFKKGRSKVDPEWAAELQKNKVMCDKFLQAAGIPIAAEKGLEADDLMAILASNCADHRVVIASNDSDMYQILQDGVCMYRGKDRGYYTRKDFVEQYGEEVASNWVEVLALSGGHNGVPSIKFPGTVKGIGETTALQIVRGDMRKERVQSLYKHKRKRIERNRKLCRLPYPLYRITKDNLRVPYKGTLREREVMRQLNIRGIQYTSSVKSMLDRLHKGL